MCSIFQGNLFFIWKHMKRNNHRILLYLKHLVIVSFCSFSYVKQVSLKNRTQQQFVTSYKIFIFWPLPLFLATQNEVWDPKCLTPNWPSWKNKQYGIMIKRIKVLLFKLLMILNVVKKLQLITLIGEIQMLKTSLLYMVLSTTLTSLMKYK